MGTNYYLHSPKPSETEPAPDPIHIGKSSGGWCFSLHVMPNEGIHDLKDWETRWNQPGMQIFNEYSDLISAGEMLDIITKRIWAEGVPFSEHFAANLRNEPHYSSEVEFHKRNCSEPGPNGLLRHQVGQHCLKQGEGTWDCIYGEFS